jgi:hypothetical protein
MPWKDKEIRNARMRERYATDPEHRTKRLADAVPKTKEQRERAYARVRKLSRKRKIEVLTHYGKHGKLQCCWKGCKVVGIDMLTLDHKNDDGARHRREIGPGNTYTSVKKLGFPEGYQTLCWNHQWKKEINRVRVQ